MLLCFVFHYARRGNDHSGVSRRYQSLRGHSANDLASWNPRMCSPGYDGSLKRPKVGVPVKETRVRPPEYYMLDVFFLLQMERCGLMCVPTHSRPASIMVICCSLTDRSSVDTGITVDTGTSERSIREVDCFCCTAPTHIDRLVRDWMHSLLTG